MPHVISKEHRFHGYNKLQIVYRKGQTTRSSLMSLKYYENPKRSSYRLAVVVSRKVHKSAVVRNRIRRRIFELFRKNEHLFGPFDMIVTVFSEQVAVLPHKELEKMIEKQLVAAKILPAKGLNNTSDKSDMV